MNTILNEYLTKPVDVKIQKYAELIDVGSYISYSNKTPFEINILFNDFIKRLRVISMIPECGKLDTSTGDVKIYSDTFINWVWRKFTGDSKFRTIYYLAKLFNDIGAFSYQLKFNTKIGEKRRVAKMLVSIAEHVKYSLVGIRNLVNTYKEYFEASALLKFIEQIIVVPQYNTLLAFIPIEYHTEILVSPVSPIHISKSMDLHILNGGAIPYHYRHSV
jgi:hypothetical protein